MNRAVWCFDRSQRTTGLRKAARRILVTAAWTSVMAAATLRAPAATQAPDASIGDAKSIESLIEDLRSSDTQRRRDAAAELARRGAIAQPALEALIQAVSDRDPQVSDRALAALANLGSTAQPVVPRLIRQLDTGDRQSWYRCAFALGKIGYMLPLKEALADGSPRVRAGAALALGWCDGAEAERAADLVGALVDEEQDVADQAIESLRRIGAAAAEPLLAALPHASAAKRVRFLRAVAAVDVGQVSNQSYTQGQPTNLSPVELAQITAYAVPLTQDTDPQVRAAAVEALASAARRDDAALAVMVRALEDSEESVREAAMAALLKHAENRARAVAALIELLDAEDDTSSAAAYVLGRIGRPAASAVPKLMAQLIRRPDADSSPAVALSRIGSPAVQALIEVYRKGEIEEGVVGSILGRMGAAARPALVTHLESGDPALRALAARGLGGLATSADRQLVERMHRCLDDPAPAVRAAAATALAQLDASDPQTVEQLVRTAGDEEPLVRAAALAALEQVGVDAEKIVAPLVEGLADPSIQVRRQSAATLARLDRIPAEVGPRLAEAVADADAQIRLHAAAAVARVARPDPDTIRRLIALVSDPERDVQRQAIESLGHLGEPAGPAVEPLLALVQSERADQDTRVVAVAALGQLGPVAAAAALPLRQMALSAPTPLRAAALASYIRTSQDRADQVQLLRQALGDSEWLVRKNSIQTLGQLGSDAAPAVPDLLKMLLDSQEEDLDELARDALRQIDAAPPEAVDSLIAILEDADQPRRNRFYALFLLRKVGPAAKSALPVLRELAEKSEGRSREFLETTIRQIESQSDGSPERHGDR